MSTKSTDYHYKDCEKIDGRMVNAYIDAHLDSENPVNLQIESTWGDPVVDLTPAVKAAETVTTMELASNAIEYIAEDGHVDCIYGDDLSHIISMTKLKDVDQENLIANGNVYIYDDSRSVFTPFDLNAYMSGVADQITQLTALVNNLRSRVVNLEELLTKPANVPDNVKVAWGNINVYGDYTGAGLKTSGVYTHDPTNNVDNDQMFE